MTRIEFDSWTAFPNPILEGLCKDKRLTIGDRVFFALIRIVIGHSYNRRGNEGCAAYSQIQKITGAGRRQVITACRTLQSNNLIAINRGNGRRPNIYTLHLQFPLTYNSGTRVVPEEIQ